MELEVEVVFFSYVLGLVEDEVGSLPGIEVGIIGD